MSLIRRLLAGIWHALDALRKVLHLVLLLFVFAVVLAAFRTQLPIVPSKAALYVAPQGQLVEQLSGDPFDRALGDLTGDREPETLVRDLVESIRAAAKDDRIRALVLDTEDLTGGGLTKLQAVGAALREFRATGKPVLAYGQYVTQAQYYLMAHADEVWLEPIGAVGVDGFASFQPFFREGLDKLGVTVNVIRAGEYKSLGEPFTRTEMSPELRAETAELVEALWRDYEADVVAARGLEPGALTAYANESVAGLEAAGGDAALFAEQRGLVTRRGNQLEFEARVEEIVGEDPDSHWANAIDADSYLSVVRSEKALTRHPAGQVAVVVGAGTIYDGEASPGNIGGDTLGGLLREARFDDDVKAVVVRIDSGGGSVLASEVIRQEIAALKDAGKPVIASFSSTAASGGYYLATAADRIVAEPSTVTGSIGVIALVPTFEGLLGKLGIRFDGVATSPLAAGARVDRALEPDVRRLLQLGVDDAYEKFVGLVATARNRTPAEVDAVAQGRMFTGARAKELGLVDELGGVEQAIAAAARLAELPEGKYGTDWRDPPLGWREFLAAQLAYAGLRARGWLGLEPSPAVRAVQGLERELRRIASLNDPRHLYYWCNCVLR